MDEEMQVEVKTLIQNMSVKDSLDGVPMASSSDKRLSEYLSNGWGILNIDYDHARMTRYVLLKKIS